MSAHQADETKELATGDVDAIQKTLIDETVLDASDASEISARVLRAVNHRRLNPRQIMLATMAGAIGANCFVAIGSGLLNGPLALLIGFVIWSTVVYAVAQCQIEIVSMFPYDGSFISLAGRMVDPSLGFAAGWCFFFQTVSFIMFEATVVSTLAAVWGYDQSPAITTAASLLLYLGLNIYRADLFGEAEFWLALGKILLILGMFAYTFITMLGGNPIHDRYGFRFWKDPGVWAGNSPSTRFQSFVNGINTAAFTIGGPEYLSMIAGESRDPRRSLPRSFKTIPARLIFFYLGSALAVSIVCPYNDTNLVTGTGAFAGSSPYVISMRRLNIPVLPTIFTVALLTTIVSAGNAYTFQSSRSLHALALEGRAPRFLKVTNSKGTPYYAVACTILLSCLAFMSVSNSSAQVLNWLLNLNTATAMFMWIVMTITSLRFHKAMDAQAVDKDAYMVYRSWCQPYAAWYALVLCATFILVQGYKVFLKNQWSAAQFVFNYGVIGMVIILSTFWKFFKKTHLMRASEIDLHTDLDFFEALSDYYRQAREERPVRLQDKILAAMFE